jgi:hypothetical protein
MKMDNEMEGMILLNEGKGNNEKEKEGNDIPKEQYNVQNESNEIIKQQKQLNIRHTTKQQQQDNVSHPKENKQSNQTLPISEVKLVCEQPSHNIIEFKGKQQSMKSNIHNITPTQMNPFISKPTFTSSISVVSQESTSIIVKPPSIPTQSQTIPNSTQELSIQTDDKSNEYISTQILLQSAFEHESVPLSEIIMPTISNSDLEDVNTPTQFNYHKPTNIKDIEPDKQYQPQTINTETEGKPLRPP